MYWTVRNSNDAENEIAQANWPKIRLFAVQNKFHNKPQSDLTGAWNVCTPETIPDFSAVAYYFGRYLHKELDVPIGLIRSAWGGTVIEAWISEDGLSEFPEFSNQINSIKDIDEDALYNPDNKKKYHQNVPTMLYNAMIAPLIDYRIAGVIWYQGEANRNRPEQYKKLMQAWIGNWREKWATGDIPFYYVQIAPYKYDGSDKTSSAFLREAQLLSLKIPHVGMAVTMDIGNENNIHPQNKQDVGKRLALWALAKTYNQKNLVYSGPVYNHMIVEGNQIRLFFDHTDGGLVSKDGPLHGFTLAGPDKKFIPANASIDSNTILVSNPEILNPVAVRYCFTNWAQSNLYNGFELPASSFRTDDWAE